MAKVLVIKTLRFSSVAEIDLVIHCLNFVPYSPHDPGRPIRDHLINVLREIRESMEDPKEPQIQEKKING